MSFAMGPIISGQIMTRFKNFTPYTIMKALFVITIINCLGFCAMMFLGCSDVTWAGDINSNRWVFTTYL